MPDLYDTLADANRKIKKSRNKESRTKSDRDERPYSAFVEPKNNQRKTTKEIESVPHEKVLMEVAQSVDLNTSVVAENEGSSRVSEQLERYRRVLKVVSPAHAMHYFLLRELSHEFYLSMSMPEVAANLGIKQNAARLIIKSLRDAELVEVYAEETSKSPRIYKMLV